MPPRRPPEYARGEGPEGIRARLDAAPIVGEMAVNQLIAQEDREALHVKLDEAIDQANIDPSFVRGFRLSQWDGMIKNNEGEAEITKLRGIQLVAEAKDLQPRWDIVRRVESEPIPFNQERNFKPGEYRREVILPDLQIGYRKYEDGTIDPFHDEKAIDVALQIIKEVQPSRVILLGDFLDLNEFGRWEKSPEFAQTTNLSIEYGHRLLRSIRELVPEAKMVLLAGNHEARLQKSIIANFREAYGLRRAGENLPVMSVPYLLALDQLNVEYVDGYPAGRYFINPSLQCIHGEIVKKGATARAVTEYEGVSTIHGHTHRIEHSGRTVRTFNGARQTYAFSPGTLSRIDGAVPSVHGSTDTLGRVVTNHEDWQNGLAVVDHDGKDFHYQQITLALDRRTRFEGKTYTPTPVRKKR